ncbi:MAG: c-type cytochrome [Longimicrobiales bacterium]
MKPSAFSLALLGVLVATPLLAQNQEPGTPPDTALRTTRDGVFDDAQAARGEAVYTESCAACHARGSFDGDVFLSRWSGRTVHDLYQLISTLMPMDNPGALSPEEYVAIIAYILELNGMPAAAAPLPTTPAALKLIRIEKESGPSR